MTRRHRPAGEPLMTPGEVKAAFGVSYTSLARWIEAGKLTALRTPGGARRYREADVRALLNPAGEP